MASTAVHRRPRFTRLVIAIPAILTLSLGAHSYYANQVELPHFSVVQRGILYRSGQPRGGGLEYVRKLGIRTIINLRSAESSVIEAEQRVAAENGIRYRSLKVGGTANSLLDSAENFLAIMRDRTNWPVLVHCSRGKERSGVLAAVYRLEFDRWHNSRALNEARHLGLAPGSLPLADSFILGYAPSWSDRESAIASMQDMPVAHWQE